MNEMKNIVVLFFLMNLSVFGQSKFTVYFDTDSHQLNKVELNRLDAFLNNKELEIIQIVGFCDFRASNGYNDKLSKNRALSVRNLIEKLTNQTSLEIIAKGENFQQESHLALNRKVEIYYDDVIVNPKEIQKETTLENQVASAQVGDKLVLKNLYFYNRSGIFVPESKPVLEELLTLKIVYYKQT